MKQIVIGCLLCLLFILSGCNQQQAQPGSTSCEGGYQVVDDAGREINLAGKPQRIVSLTYGTDEILTDLVDSKRIVAYSRWAGDEGITFITKEQARIVGCRMDENTEKILLLQPDLVFVSTSASEEFVKSLENMQIPVYQAGSPDSFEEMREKVFGIAQAVGEQERGRQLVSGMDARLSRLQKQLAGLEEKEKKVAVAFGFESAIGRRGGLLDDMLTKSHVINGAGLLPGEMQTNHISKELVVQINPDIFLLPTWNYDNKHNVNGYYNSVLYDPAYKDVTAIKQNQLKFINDKYRYVNSHHVIDAIENIARSVYPHIFRGEK